jgi:hypothetical protein
MTSQINPSTINAEYPVAGQDNSTQGFRDNFSFTRQNFQRAADEITDLQNKVLLKAPLSGTTLNNNLNGVVLDGAKIQNFSAAQFNIGAVSGPLTIEYSVGHYQSFTIVNSVTLNFTSFPGGNQAWIILRVTADAGDTLILPPAVGEDSGDSKSSTSLQGIQGLNGQTITFAESGSYEFEFRTTDNGSTIYITELSRPKSRWTNPLFVTGTEQVANTATISLNTATSFFSTSTTNQTATLAAGADGQLKSLAMAVKGTGNVTVTVSNAGWKTSGTGTVAFTALGHACTLQYFNSKWYCIGNNGCTFA